MGVTEMFIKRTTLHGGAPWANLQRLFERYSPPLLALHNRTVQGRLLNNQLLFKAYLKRRHLSWF